MLASSQSAAPCFSVTNMKKVGGSLRVLGIEQVVGAEGGWVGGLVGPKVGEWVSRCKHSGCSTLLLCH
jgi:hypothetical protein